MTLVGSTPAALAIRPGGDVVGAAGRAAAPGYRARVGLELGDQAGHVLDVGCRRNDQRLVFAGQPGDRRDLVEGDRRGVGEDRADHDVAADDQLRGIAIGLVDELGKPDRAAGAWNVGHLHAARNALVLQRGLHGAGRLVPAAARGGRRHDLVVGRKRGSAHRKAGNAGDRQQQFPHRIHPPFWRSHVRDRLLSHARRPSSRPQRLTIPEIKAFAD